MSDGRQSSKRKDFALVGDGEVKQFVLLRSALAAAERMEKYVVWERKSIGGTFCWIIIREDFRDVRYRRVLAGD